MSKENLLIDSINARTINHMIINGNGLLLLSTLSLLYVYLYMYTLDTYTRSLWHGWFGLYVLLNRRCIYSKDNNTLNVIAWPQNHHLHNTIAIGKKRKTKFSRYNRSQKILFNERLRWYGWENDAYVNLFTNSTTTGQQPYLTNCLHIIIENWFCILLPPHHTIPHSIHSI